MDAARSALRSGAGQRDGPLPPRLQRRCPPRPRRSRPPGARASCSGSGPSSPRSSARTARCARCGMRRAGTDRRRRGRPGRLGRGARLRGAARRPTTILVAIGEEPDPSILPEGAGHRDQRLGRDRRRPADAGHRTGRRLRRRRRRRRSEDDHRRGRRRPARRRRDPRVPGRRRATARPTSSAAVRYRTPPEPSLSARPRADAARGARHRCPIVERHRSAPTRPGSTTATARGEASRCFRCDAVYGCPTVARHRRSRPGGRTRTGPSRTAVPPPGDAASQPDRPRPRASSRRRPMTARTGRRASSTPARASSKGRSARRSSRSGCSPSRSSWRGRTWPRNLAQVHPAAGRRPVVDHLRRAPRHPAAPGLPRAASSSSTRTSSAARTCRSPAGWPPCAPSRAAHQAGQGRPRAQLVPGPGRCSSGSGRRSTSCRTSSASR